MSEKQAEFTITRSINAQQEQVWAAWTQVELMAKWLPSTHVDAIEMDFQEGGKYRYTMTNEETAKEIHTGGVYLEIEANTRLVMTWGEPEAPVEDTPVINLTLDSQDEATEMKFTLIGFEGHPGDNYVYDGWVETLD